MALGRAGVFCLANRPAPAAGGTRTWLPGRVGLPGDLGGDYFGDALGAGGKDGVLVVEGRLGLFELAYLTPIFSPLGVLVT
jgi:hypothetical protein